jgi:hypothetical protein
MPAFPEMPSQLRGFFPSFFWNWWQAFRTYLLSNFFTSGDITVQTAGKGVILSNKAGTITQRVFLKDDGSGVDVEDV